MRTRRYFSPFAGRSGRRGVGVAEGGFAVEEVGGGEGMEEARGEGEAEEGLEGGRGPAFASLGITLFSPIPRDASCGTINRRGLEISSITSVRASITTPFREFREQNKVKSATEDAVFQPFWTVC